MGQQRHVILRQTVELSIANSDDAWPLQQEASLILRKAGPLIERCCDEMSSPDRLHRVERLELDLGVLDRGRLEEELLGKFGQALRRGLAEQIDRQDSTELPPKTVSQLELFSQFARCGSLPWWADLAKPGQPQACLDTLLREAPELLRRLLPDLARDAKALRRLAGHFDDRRLAALVFLLSPALADFPLALAEALASLQAELPALAAVPPSRFRSHVWQSILANAALTAPAERLDFSRGVLMRLARLQDLPYDVLVGGLAQPLPSFEKGESQAQGTIQASPPFEKGGQGGIDRNAVELRIFPFALSLSKGEWKNRSHPIIKPFMLRQAQHDRLNSTALGIDRSPDEARGVRESEATDAPHSTSAMRATLTKLAEGIPGQNPSNPPFAKGGQGGIQFSEADNLYLGNAGLVILWPFLTIFFARLGLLEENRFIGEAARQRGVALLHYIATTDPQPPEYLLPLNKLLCGMDTEAVFELEKPLTELETAECESLLEAVIEQAPILNHMSVQGFRGSFLLRAGILSIRDGGWLLRVERETYDLVLDRFPWGFEWVRLPWMEAPLRVEW